MDLSVSNSISKQFVPGDTRMTVGIAQGGTVYITSIQWCRQKVYEGVSTNEEPNGFLGFVLFF